MELKLFGSSYLIGNSKKIKNEIRETLGAESSAFAELLSGGSKSINANTALKIAVVIRCADVVAKTMASLGCHLYRKIGKQQERAINHNIYKLLRYMPNPETTAYEFWHMYIFNLMLTSGAYAKIIRNQGSGQIKEIWNIPTSKVQPGRDKNTGERYIDVALGNSKYERLYEVNFMHTPGLRFNDPDSPTDFINLAADVLGLTRNLNDFAADYFENGSNLGGFIEYPTALNRDAFTKFKEEWARTYSGVMNQHKWAILEGGFKVTKMESNPEEAQALESRKFQIIEVCRIMGVTPHKAFSLEGVNYNSIEQLNIEFWQETIDPMDERVTQTIFKDLLSALEQNQYYAKFNINKLLKGDTKTRTEYYNSMRQNGVFTTNMILELEDYNTISAEEGGDVRLVNGNMIPLTAAKDNLPKALQNKGNKEGGS